MDKLEEVINKIIARLKKEGWRVELEGTTLPEKGEELLWLAEQVIEPEDADIVLLNKILEDF